MTVPLSTAVLVALAAGLVAFLTGGVAWAAQRARVARPGRLAGGVLIGLGAWLASVAALALSGVLEVREGKPPLEPLLMLSALAGYVLLGRTATFRRLLPGVPDWLPVGAQVFRFGVEFALWQLHREGLAPIQVTFEGRNYDGLVALSAPFVAAGLAVGWIGPRAVVVWNAVGLVGVGNAVFTAATSAPGPQHLDWPGEPFAALFSWPVLWIPTLFVPTAVFLHLTSIRQALSRIAAGGQDPQGTTGHERPRFTTERRVGA